MDPHHPYTISHISTHGILYVTVDGAADIAAVAAYSATHIDVWAAHPRLVWDLRRMDFDRVSADAIRHMSARFTDVTTRRAGGRTALVVSTPEGFALGRMVLAYAESRAVPITHRLFWALPEAEAWLRAE